MTTPNRERIVLAIEVIEQLLLEGQRAEAALRIGELPKEIDDADLGVEAADVFFRHGLLEHAERWSDQTYQRWLTSRTGYVSTSRDLLWLRVNVAWQRGDMTAVRARLEELMRHLGRSYVEESLGLVAGSVTSLESGRRTAARTMASKGLQLGKELLRVRFTAGAVLMEVAPDQGRPVLEALARRLGDAGSEEAAFADVARTLLPQGIDHWDSQPVHWYPHDRMAYDMAWRYAAAVTKLVAPQTSASAGAVCLDRVPTIPGWSPAPGANRNDTLDVFEPAAA
jgi:hypothetical protein